MVERALVCHGQQRVLVAGIELLRAASKRFGPWPKREIAQAAFFEFGKLAANIVSWARNHTSDAEFATESDAYLGATQTLICNKRADRIRQFMDTLFGIQRGCVFSPTNRAGNNAITRAIGVRI